MRYDRTTYLLLMHTHHVALRIQLAEYRSVDDVRNEDRTTTHPQGQSFAEEVARPDVVDRAVVWSHHDDAGSESREKETKMSAAQKTWTLRSDGRLTGWS